MNLAQHILIGLLRVYRAVISPGFTALFAPHGLGCRFTPTCSEYVLDAVRAHGALRGLWLGGRRLCRCHPWGGCGHDPVPPKQGHQLCPEVVELARKPPGSCGARFPSSLRPAPPVRSADFPVCGLWGLSSPHDQLTELESSANPQTGKSALRAGAGAVLSVAALPRCASPASCRHGS